MTIQSLEKQLCRGFVIRASLVMGLMWALGLGGAFLWSKHWMAQELAQDSQSLLGMLSQEGEQPIRLESTSHRVNFNQPFSGHYYVLHGQHGVHLTSPSLQDFVIQLPERTQRAPLIFFTPGPQGHDILVHFSEYQFNGRWLDIAVARDALLMQNVMRQWGMMFSVAMLLIWFGLVMLNRVMLKRRFQAVALSAGDLGLESLQSNLLAKHWPIEWFALADRLHQALIQLRGGMVRKGEPSSGYQVTLPYDLQRHIEPYHITHPHIQIHLIYRNEPRVWLMAQQDLYTILKSVLDNACQWGRSQIWLTVSHQDDQLCLQIEDDGEGMPSERLAQVQERTQNQGTGEVRSGLMVVEGIVRAYQGKLEFGHSVPLGGLSVKLCFSRPNF